MLWLAARLREARPAAQTVSPEDVIFTEEGLFLAGSTPLTVLYRFFELFDLKNIPKSELIMYAVKKGRLALTPPMKPWLEGKTRVPVVDHPALQPSVAHAIAADAAVRH